MSISNPEWQWKRSRPSITIELLDRSVEGSVAKPSSYTSYTTLDRIEGKVSITAETDTPFDEIKITFEGSATTFVERANPIPGQAKALHTFLKLRQPITESEYPTPRVLEGRRVYQFPFTFVVPERMLPQSCNHDKDHINIFHSHTQLPPSLGGDPIIARDGKSTLDDLSPKMAQVAYMIRAVVTKDENSNNNNNNNNNNNGGQVSSKLLASVEKPIRIIPTIEEEPPLTVADHPRDYCTRKEKVVKRGLLRRALGRIVVAAAQPAPLQLHACEGTVMESGGVATVQVRFDPVGDEQPPPLGKLWSKLKVMTFYSGTPWASYPSASSALVCAQYGKGMYQETIPLSSLCVASAQWTKHGNLVGGTPRTSRQGSLCSESSFQSSTPSSFSSSSSASTTESLTGPSALNSSTYYTTSLVVPLSLPDSKAFIPTFHSCIISRTYTLDLSLSFHPPNTSFLSPCVSLRVPLQITAAGSQQPTITTTTTPLTGAEQEDPLFLASLSQEVEEFFSPRSVAPRTGVEEEEAERPAFPPQYTDVVNSVASENTRQRSLRAC
ncbi:hypothetical protein ASPZODRAFT_1396799 [Penicilliopsis zonata CBS 506.65]|uniref:Arrestin-like N-terminal domain-containing protein n=1 Tax=Penicilliopsis zonata CBS 506.65 TaxID=1073090 RepID=A0A1L9SPH2_9EURO|nr:hypothetical protein ASPZODRAFT_1396799 [Penicilliopsis zonata CBS 506.65]OJJ49100.1 hypothetical protein ASPZODRAFT_1396799 [Penicilliopsis zonata CBS 506.65]